MSENAQNDYMQEESWFHRYKWAVLFLLVAAVGLSLLISCWTNPPLDAQITRVGKITKRTESSGRSSRKKTVYYADLTVEFEEDGAPQTADLSFRFGNYWSPPRVGKTVQVTRNILGKVVSYPRATEIAIGWVLLVVGGIFLAGVLRMLQVSKTRNPYLIHGTETGDAGTEGAGTEGAGPPLPELQAVKRLENGTCAWTCPVDEEQNRSAFRITMVTVLIICALLMVMGLLMGDTMVIGVMAATCGFALLLAFIIGKLMTRKPGIQYCEMTTEHIHIGRGKGSSWAAFRNVIKLERMGNKMILQGPFAKNTVFLPPEDQEVLSEYIERRVRETSPHYRE